MIHRDALHEARHARILGALVGEASPQRARLVALLLDAAERLPLAVVLEEADVVELLLGALSEENARAAADHLVLPSLARGSALGATLDTPLGAFVPPPFEARLRVLLAAGQGPRFAWLAGAVDPALLRQLLGPVVQQVLLQFARKLPIPGAAPAGKAGAALGGLAGKMAKQLAEGASRLAEAGQGMMGGLGAELDRRLQAVARDFSQTAIEEFRGALRARLQSDEGRRLVGELRSAAVAHVLATPVATIVADLDRLPRTEIAELVVPVVGHQAGQPWLRSLLEGELAAAVAAFGSVPLGATLEAAGLRGAVRSRAEALGDRWAREVFAEAAFSTWLDDLLRDPG